MSAFANVVIGDASAVATTFKPTTIDPNGVAKYAESNSIILARRTLSSSVRLPAKGSQVARVQYKIVTPVMDTVDAHKKLGEHLCNIEFVCPTVGSAAQRKDILFFAYNYLAHASVIPSLEFLESIY